MPFVAMRVFGRIMDVDDVDLGHAEALQAVLDRPLGAVGRIIVLAAKRQRLAGGFRGREQRELAERKVPLLERFQHFDSNGSGGSDNGDMQVLAHKKEGGS